MLLRVLYCSRTSLLLFYFARKGRRGGESERGISFRSPSRFVKGTKMDTAILENKPAFALCHDHQTLYIVCKKTANCSLKGDKMFYANGTDVAVKFNFFAFGCWQETVMSLGMRVCYRPKQTSFPGHFSWNLREASIPDSKRKALETSLSHDAFPDK